MHFEIHRAEEDALIDGCLKQEKTAQERLYSLYSSKMLAVCRRYVKDVMAAEDVLVSAFLKVFERIAQFKKEGSFEGWIRRIVVNESLTYLRRNHAVYLETNLEAAERAPNYSDLDAHLGADDLIRMIDGLPPGYRAVFNMYAVDGYSHKEIAAHLGITEGTSKSQLNRARGYLKKMLLEIEEEWTTKKGSHESST